jgi:hypothetical protein
LNGSSWKQQGRNNVFYAGRPEMLFAGQLRVDSWHNELVVRQLTAGKNLSTESETIVGIRHQATTGEKIGNWNDFMCAVRLE